MAELLHVRTKSHDIRDEVMLKALSLVLMLLPLCIVSPAAGQTALEGMLLFEEPAHVDLVRPELDGVALRELLRRPVSRQEAEMHLEFEQHPRPRLNWVLIGAGAGATVGAAAFLLTSDGCWRESDSMCELAIPLYVGGGAVAGGLFGYLVGRRGRDSPLPPTGLYIRASTLAKLQGPPLGSGMRRAAGNGGMLFANVAGLGWPYHRLHD